MVLAASPSPLKDFMTLSGLLVAIGGDEHLPGRVTIMISQRYLKLKICFQIFSYLANSRYSFSPKP